MQLSRAELARYIDHTLLAPTATPADVAAALAEAEELRTYAFCMPSSFLPLTGNGTVKIGTTCGFPSGKHSLAVKAAEAAEAIALGADEVDMVIDLGLARTGDAAALTAEIAAVRDGIPAPKVLKVIVESAALTDDEIVLACQCAEAAGADFVKTSTGFHPAGGASVHAIALMARTVGGRLGIKASGGIRDHATALAMIEAGATRLGLSASRAVLDGTTADSSY